MKPADDPTADGYYAEDNMGDDELDLSFLDESESDEAGGTGKSQDEDQNGQSPTAADGSAKK